MLLSISPGWLLFCQPWPSHLSGTLLPVHVTLQLHLYIEI